MQTDKTPDHQKHANKIRNRIGQRVWELIADLDLPEANDPSMFVPGGKGWVLEAEGFPVVWTSPGMSVMIQRIEPGDLTPAEAFEFALNILAAAVYSEGENND